MATPRRPGVARTAVRAFALALGMSACGSGGAGASVTPVETSTVDLPPSYRFEPAAIAVVAGTTVTWTNHDNFTHSVKILDGGLPTEPMVMQPGGSTTFDFTTPGTYNYLCHLHPQNMKGTVVVRS